MEQESPVSSRRRIDAGHSCLHTNCYLLSDAARHVGPHHAIVAGHARDGVGIPLGLQQAEKPERISGFEHPFAETISAGT